MKNALILILTVLLFEPIPFVKSSCEAQWPLTLSMNDRDIVVNMIDYHEKASTLVVAGRTSLDINQLSGFLAYYNVSADSFELTNRWQIEISIYNNKLNFMEVVISPNATFIVSHATIEDTSLTPSRYDKSIAVFDTVEGNLKSLRFYNGGMGKVGINRYMRKLLVTNEIAAPQYIYLLTQLNYTVQNGQGLLAIIKMGLDAQSSDQQDYFQDLYLDSTSCMMPLAMLFAKDYDMIGVLAYTNSTNGAIFQLIDIIDKSNQTIQIDIKTSQRECHAGHQSEIY